MRNTITSISSTIIKEFTSKLNYYLKRTFNYIPDFDDVRDIIIKIKKFNENNIINCCTKLKLISCHINELYDDITKCDCIDSINYAINNLLPFNYFDYESYDLLRKSTSSFFDNSCFKFQNNRYKQFGSMIQGSISERDISNLVLIINEIKNRNLFNKYLILMGDLG